MKLINRSLTPLFIFFTTVLPFLALSEETSVTQDNKNKTPHIIESLVQGSQEQPNVIYITPWQQNEKAINIAEQPFIITLPKITPITPRAFNKRLNTYQQSIAFNESDNNQ